MSPVVVLPQAAEPLLCRFGIAFTPRTFQRVLLLFVGSVLALGRNTVTGPHACRGVGALHGLPPRVLPRPLVAVAAGQGPGGDGAGTGADSRAGGLLSLLHPRANLYTPPPPRRGGRPGRPRVKGDKLPAPQDVVARSKRKRSTVGWYGGKSRRVEFVSGTGHWYKGGGGLVPVRWVFVHDLEGTHEDRYFYCTDPALSPSRIVTLYTGRWSIEVTFQEARQHLGFHTPRSWTRPSVLRTAPCLLGLFSLVCLIHHRHTRGEGARPLTTQWHHKAEPTFADAVASVRRLLWSQTVLKQADRHGAFQKLPPDLRNTLLDQLTRAA